MMGRSGESRGFGFSSGVEFYITQTYEVDTREPRNRCAIEIAGHGTHPKGGDIGSWYF